MATSTDEDSDTSSPKSEPGFRFSLKLSKTKKPGSYFEDNAVTIQVRLFLNAVYGAKLLDGQGQSSILQYIT